MLIRCIAALAVVIFMCNGSFSFNLFNLRNIIEDMDRKASVDYLDRKIVSYYFTHSGDLPASTGDRLPETFIKNCGADVLGKEITDNINYQNHTTMYRLGVLLSNGTWYFGRNSYDVTRQDLMPVVKERI